MTAYEAGKELANITLPLIFIIVGIVIAKLLFKKKSNICLSKKTKESDINA